MPGETTTTSGGLRPGKIRTLWALTRGQRRRYLAAALALGAGAALQYVAPLIVGVTIDGILDNRLQDQPAPARVVVALLGGRHSLMDHLWLAAAGVVLASSMAGAMMYLKGRWAAVASERITQSLRNRLYDHLQHVSCAYHDGAQTGDLVQRCTSDVETVRNFYSTQLVEIARATFLLLGAVPLMLWLDWRLGLVAVGLLPVIVTFAVVFFHKVQGSFKQADEAEGAMTTVLQENLTGIRVVRAFARQDFERAKFGRANDSHRELNWKLFKVMAVFWACSDMMCFTQMAAVLVYGVHRVGSGVISIGLLVTFLAYLQIYLWPVRQMGRILSELGKAMVSLGRIQEVLAEPEEAKPHPDAAPPAPGHVEGRIVLDNVSFSHRGNVVLSNVSFIAEPGETVALLGPSGAGKSTIVHLLLRFYDYDSGSISLDGTEIRELDRKFVRSRFGVVMQEPFLYSKSIRDNIRLGRFSAAHGEVVEASQVASIHESIENFEKGYETVVGERGVTLSGGQRQRVAIARALLKDAPVLVLDDALSAVDTHTEAAILGALKSRRGRHTTLVIAHRLSTLMHADKILVLEHGRIVQSGTHEQLVNRPGLYRNLWHIQSELEADLKQEMGSSEPETRPVGRLQPSP